MSEGLHGEILSREEMDALLGTLAQQRIERERRARGATAFRREGADRSRQSRYPALHRALGEFGQSIGAALSTSHQTPIAFEVLACEEAAQEEVAATLLPIDRGAVLSVPGVSAPGYLLWNRALAYGLLCLAFGARPGLSGNTPPPRPYTRIERRFLLRLARQLVSHLAASLEPLLGAGVAVDGLCEPERLAEEGHERVVVGSFDVRGLGELCRLRVVLPAAPLRRLETAPAAPAGDQRVEIERKVAEAPVRVAAEVGRARLPLERLVRLAPGDVIALEEPEGGGVVLRIEDRPRFRGIRGRVGDRLAVQVTERIEGG